MDNALLDERLARGIHDDVGGEHGEVRADHVIEDLILPEIELVVPEAHGVVTAEVQEIHRGVAHGMVDEVLALHGIACVEQQHLVALLLVVALEGNGCGEP